MLKKEEILTLSEQSLINERYRIDQILGIGGHGITYSGWDVFLERKVAIKEFFKSGFSRKESKIIIPSDLSNVEFEENKKSYLDEARKLGKFNNPNIVKIFDFFEANNTCYIIMEFINGESLQEHIEKKGTYDESETKDIILEVLNGLKATHAKNILHRDIKPENILIDNETLKVVLVDFGSAREYTSEKSMDMSRIISDGYAPLEQYSSRGKFGPELDIYSLGATMYKMLAGKIPPNPVDRIQKSKTLQELEELDISNEIKKTIKKCLEISIDKRFSSADELEKAFLTPDYWDNSVSNEIEEHKKIQKLTKSNYQTESKSIYNNNKEFSNSKPISSTNNYVKRRKKHFRSPLLILLITVAFLIVFSLVFGLFNSTTKKELITNKDTTTNEDAILLNLYTVDWGGDYKVYFDEYDTGVAFAFEFKNWTATHEISSKWYKPDGNLLYDGDLFALEATDDGIMKQFIGFNFSKSEVLLNYFKNNPGKWKIDVYLDEEFLHSLFFVFE